MWESYQWALDLTHIDIFHAKDQEICVHLVLWLPADAGGHERRRSIHDHLNYYFATRSPLHLDGDEGTYSLTPRFRTYGQATRGVSLCRDRQKSSVSRFWLGELYPLSGNWYLFDMDPYDDEGRLYRAEIKSYSEESAKVKAYMTYFSMYRPYEHGLILAYSLDWCDGKLHRIKFSS